MNWIDLAKVEHSGSLGLASWMLEALTFLAFLLTFSWTYLTIFCLFTSGVILFIQIYLPKPAAPHFCALVVSNNTHHVFFWLCLITYVFMGFFEKCDNSVTFNLLTFGLLDFYWKQNFFLLKEFRLSQHMSELNPRHSLSNINVWD